MPSNDRIASQRIVSQGGLNTLNNYLTLSLQNPGAAVRLQNFESSLSGGYQRVRGFRKLDNTPVGMVDSTRNSTGKILGIQYFYNTATEKNELYAAREDLSSSPRTYSWWIYDVEDKWTQITTGLTLRMTSSDNSQEVFKIRSEIFNFGTGNQMIAVDGVNNAYIFDGTTWYKIDPSGTGGDANPGGDQALAAPSLVTIFKNHIFVSGDPDYPAIVAHSAPEDATTWTSSAGAGQLPYGFDVVQIKPFRDDLFVFGETNIKKIVVDNTTFVYKDVTNNLGCVARDSVVEINGYLVFLSQDGIRPIAGTMRIDDVEMGLLSQQIQELIDTTFTNYDLRDLDSVVIRRKTQFRYFFSNELIPVEDALGLIGCFRIYPQAGAPDQNNGWEFSTLKGIRTSATWSGLINTQEVVLHGDHADSTNDDAYVYIEESGNSFDGSDITAIYISPYLDMGDTTLRKTHRVLHTFVKAEGSVTLNLGIRYDWDDPDAINPTNYSYQIGGGVLYDDPGTIYDDADTTYGGVTRTIWRENIQGSFYSVQYIFSSIDQSAPYTIHGFVHEFTVDGRQ